MSFFFHQGVCVVVGTFALVYQSVAHPHDESKFFNQIGNLWHVAFAPTQEPTETGGTDSVLADLGASECALVFICFTLQNKVQAPIKTRVIWLPSISVVHDICINICNRSACLTWLTDVLMVHYCVKQNHNLTLTLLESAQNDYFTK